MSTNSNPRVSVVIPVYDDYGRLSTCLEALAQQTYPGDDFEIVVVDNGTPEERVVAVEEEFANVRRTSEEKQGSYAARNRGLEVADGELFAFTDADCIPTEAWLERGIEALTSSESIGLVGGSIELFAHEEDAPTAAELWELRRGFPQRHYVEELDFAATANMFTRRSVFEEVGRFDADLRSGGDRDWGERVAEAGFDQVYASEAFIRHPARRTLPDLLQKMVRTTRGDYRRREQNGEFSPLTRSWRMLRAAGDLALGPVRFGWTALAAPGSLGEGIRFAAADGLVRATRELVALEQLGTRLAEPSSDQESTDR